MTSHTIDIDTKSLPTNQEASAGGSLSPRDSTVAIVAPPSTGQDLPITVTNPLSSVVTGSPAKPMPTGAAPDNPGSIPVSQPTDPKWIDSLLRPPDSIVEDKAPQRAEDQATNVKAVSSSSPRRSTQPSQQKPASAAARSAHSIVMITNLQVSEQPPTAAVASPRQRVNLEPLKGAPTPSESIGGRNLVSLQPLVKSPTGDVSGTPVTRLAHFCLTCASIQHQAVMSSNLWHL